MVYDLFQSCTSTPDINHVGYKTSLNSDKKITSIALFLDAHFSATTFAFKLDLAKPFAAA